MSATGTAPHAYQRSMTGWHVAVLMIAAAAPLSSMLGNVPGGLIFGNGPGLPSAFLAAAVLMSVLIIVYLHLHRAMPDVTGFAGYVKAGFGIGAGAGTAYVTLVSYTAATLSYAVGVGYFGSLIAASYGLQLPWWVLSLAAFLATFLLGRRGADISGRAVMVLVGAEFALLIIMNVLIVAAQGVAAFPLESFTPTAMFSGQPGLALMTGLTSFVGIEAGILYSRETRNAGRAIPRAIYSAIAAVAVFYVVTTWIIIGGLGADSAVAAAVELQGDVVFGLAYQFGGSALLIPMQIFFVGSVLASSIAMHNASSRYMADLALNGNLPRGLGILHGTRGVPSRASDLISIVGAALVVIFAIAQVNPYIGLGSSLVGLLTIGLFSIQIVVVAAAFRYMTRAKTLTPGLAAACLGGGSALFIAVAMMIANYSVLTGSDSPWASLPLLLLPIAFVAGFAVVSRRNRGGTSHVTVEEPIRTPII